MFYRCTHFWSVVAHHSSSITVTKKLQAKVPTFHLLLFPTTIIILSKNTPKHHLLLVLPFPCRFPLSFFFPLGTASPELLREGTHGRAARIAHVLPPLPVGLHEIWRDINQSLPSASCLSKRRPKKKEDV